MYEVTLTDKEEGYLNGVESDWFSVSSGQVIMKEYLLIWMVECNSRGEFLNPGIVGRVEK